MYFWLEFEKKAIAIFLISNLEFFNMRSFKQNRKYLHLGQKMLHLCIFGLEFDKGIAIFEINALKFSWLQSLVQNKNP